MSNLEKFKKYYENVDLKGEFFLDRFWIKSNKHYIFIVDGFTQDKTYAMFSKKYYLTIELTKDKKLLSSLDEFAKIVDLFREENDLEVEKFEFWLPHCQVNGHRVETQFIAESYGVSPELALDYLVQYDEVFNAVYDKKKKEYFGLPLFLSREEAENYSFKENTKKYLKGLKIVDKFRRRNT